MPFTKKRAIPIIHDWEPDADSFDHEVDRLLVRTDWEDTIILAWSPDVQHDGGLIIAPEAMPDNIADFFRGKLDPIEYEPGRSVQPEVSVTQVDNHCLRFDLIHPEFEGRFETMGHVSFVQPTKRGRRKYSEEVKGYRRTSPQRRAAS